MRKDNKNLLVGIILGMTVILAVGATVYKSIVGTGSVSGNTIVLWDGANGNKIKASGVSINSTNGVSGIQDLAVSGNITSATINASTVTVTQVTGRISTNNLPTNNIAKIGLYTNATVQIDEYGRVVDVTNGVVSGGVSPTTTRGDIIVRGGSADERLPIGPPWSTLTTIGTNVVWGATSNTVGFGMSEFIGWASGIDRWVDDCNSGGTVTSEEWETTSPGLLKLNITTTGSSRASLYLRGGTDVLQIGNGSEIICEFRFRVSALSDGTDTYTIRAGLFDTRPDVESTDAIGVRYTHSVNSGKYEFVTRSNNTETANDTGLTPSTTTMQTFLVVINSAGTSAILYTNGVACVTNVSNIPTGTSRRVSPGIFGITRNASVGSNERYILLDYHYIPLKVNR